MDGEAKTIESSPGEDLNLTVGADGELTLADPAALPPPPPQRLFPDLPEGCLCQSCKRPTNKTERKELVDCPWVFQFNGKPVMVLCFECYTNGTMLAAKQAWRDGVG